MSKFLSHLVTGVFLSASLALAQNPIYVGPCPAGADDPLANTTWAFQARGTGRSHGGSWYVFHWPEGRKGQ